MLARREATAAFMAEGLAMATGGVGACLSTLGPGSTALANGVASATLDRVPVVALSGQIDSGREQYFTHQVVDHDRLYAPITKWAGRIEPSSVATTMRRALRLATAERPGAVHLTLPADVGGRPATDGEASAPPLVPAVVATTVFTTGPEPAAVLAAARRPVLLAGIGAVRAAATADAGPAGRDGLGAGGGRADGQGRVPGGPPAVRRRPRHGLWPGALGPARLGGPGRHGRLRPRRADHPMDAADAGPARRRDPERRPDLRQRLRVRRRRRRHPRLARRRLAGTGALDRGGDRPAPRPAARGVLLGRGGGPAQPDRRGRRRTPGRAAADAGHHRRRLAQAARRPGLARVRAAQRADDQRPVLHGLRRAGRHRREGRRPRTGRSSRWWATAGSR